MPVATRLIQKGNRLHPSSNCDSVPPRLASRILQLATDPLESSAFGVQASDFDGDSLEITELPPEDVEVDDQDFVINLPVLDDDEFQKWVSKEAPQQTASHLLKSLQNLQFQNPESNSIPQKVRETYGKIAHFLKHYKSGKVPKAFKIIPLLENWEDILLLTKPSEWSPQAMYQATHLFASNCKARMAQRFYNMFLLPAVRDNISQYKHLNYHYYQALKKAIFKPSAWFKGILLPMLNETCSLSEANIIGSVLIKVSIPVLHSAAALVKISQIAEWDSSISYIMTILINKKYSLPQQVISILVSFFERFIADQRKLPVIWHKCLLSFCQRYKGEIDSCQRKSLMSLLQMHTHHAITSEIRRELCHPCVLASAFSMNVDNE